MQSMLCDDKKKSFNIDNKKNPYDEYELNYWLYEWIRIYSFIFKKYKLNRNVTFVDYDKYCKNKNFYLSKIFSTDKCFSSEDIFANKKNKKIMGIDKNLKLISLELYENILSQPI